MHSQLVVLGGGPAGYAAAFLAADRGREVTIVESEARLGGTCLLRGCIPSKALLHVARVLSETRELSDSWGVRFAPPEIDLDTLRARKDVTVTNLSKGLGQLAKRRNVRVVPARGTFESSTTLRLDHCSDPNLTETHLTFDHAILATGSGPILLDQLATGSPRVLNSSTALDLPDIPESLLVIGGGYIGLELGTVYARLGSRVSVVEMMDGLLPGVDRDLVRPLERHLKKAFFGDRIYLNTKVESLVDLGDVLEARFLEIKSGGADRTECFSRVLVSVGRRPASQRIGLETTGVQVDAHGFVVTDSSQRTADPHILAIGDVAGEPMLAHKATYQAKVAVDLLDGRESDSSHRVIPAVVFTDPEIAWAGLTEEEAKQQNRAYRSAIFPWAASGRAHTLGRNDGLTKWLVDPDSDRLLGCGIVGAGAGELISEAVLAIQQGCTVHDVADAIHPHPTLAETLSNAAEVDLGAAIDIYKPRR